MTCNQGAEHIAPCTRKSLVYENVCGRCNEGAKEKKELEDVDPTIPSIYVGESSHIRSRRGAGSIGLLARGVDRYKKGATFTSINSSTTMEQNPTSS